MHLKSNIFFIDFVLPLDEGEKLRGIVRDIKNRGGSRI